MIHILLDRLFRAVFLDAPKEVDKLLRPDAALGSNGSRYQLAYCLGLIQRDQRDDLRIIARIRNQFSHRFTPLSFDDQPVCDLCANLNYPRELLGMPDRLFAPHIADTAKSYVSETIATNREKFRPAIFGLVIALLRRLNIVQRATANESRTGNCWGETVDRAVLSTARLQRASRRAQWAVRSVSWLFTVSPLPLHRKPDLMDECQLGDG